MSPQVLPYFRVPAGVLPYFRVLAGLLGPPFEMTLPMALGLAPVSVPAIIVVLLLLPLVLVVVLVLVALVVMVLPLAMPPPMIHLGILIIMRPSPILLVIAPFFANEDTVPFIMASLGSS